MVQHIIIIPAQKTSIYACVRLSLARSLSKRRCRTEYQRTQGNVSKSHLHVSCCVPRTHQNTSFLLFCCCSRVKLPPQKHQQQQQQQRNDNLEQNTTRTGVPSFRHNRPTHDSIFWFVSFICLSMPVRLPVRILSAPFSFSYSLSHLLRSS